MFEYSKQETLLKVENVSLELGGNTILKDVNVEIKNIVRPNLKQGQVIGFLGPSGVGKTKFFEILSGLLKPTTGTVLIGKDLKPVEPGIVGVVQQNYPLFEFRTVFGNLEIAARKGGIESSQRKNRIEHVLNQFGLLKHKDKWISELSGGQRQRIAIAQQLLCSENFLLLDEPFSGLDVIMIEKVLDMIREISSSNELLTTIIVSHDIISTTSISDTLWIMGRDRNEKGEIIPGGKIKHNYDLIEMGLAWQKGIETSDKFNALVKEIRNTFQTL
jgi:polar amino acid transport system ATP-binding protein/sulfate transport system ATP-binding protein